MNARKPLLTAAVMSFVALPAIAQTSSTTEKSGHYTVGPKTEIPHQTGKKSTGSKPTSGGSHHYGGGPKTDVPHHMGAKQQQ